MGKVLHIYIYMSLDALHIYICVCVSLSLSLSLSLFLSLSRFTAIHNASLWVLARIRKNTMQLYLIDMTLLLQLCTFTITIP